MYTAQHNTHTHTTQHTHVHTQHVTRTRVRKTPHSTQNTHHTYTCTQNTTHTLHDTSETTQHTHGHARRAFCKAVHGCSVQFIFSLKMNVNTNTNYCFLTNTCNSLPILIRLRNGGPRKLASIQGRDKNSFLHRRARL